MAEITHSIENAIMKLSGIKQGRGHNAYIMAGLIVFLAMLGLSLSASIEHSPSTIPFLHLRPVDMRLRVMTLGIGYFGILFGLAHYLIMRNAKRPVSTMWLLLGVTILGFVSLSLNGEPNKLAFYLSAMAGLNGVICCFAMRLTDRPIPQRLRVVCRLLLFLSPLMGLVGLMTGGLSPAGLLVPTYWIGETLQLEFLTYPFMHAVMVGICFHLFMVMCLLGLLHQSEND